MGYYDMTPAEIKREIKENADREAWEAYGPCCWACHDGSNFAQKDYPYALSRDVTYCKEWNDLMEDPHTPDEDLKDCWR